MHPHQGTISPEVLEQDYTPTSIEFGVFFGTQIFLGPIGLVLSRTKMFLFNMFNLAEQNFAKWHCVRNVHMCTLCHT